MENRGRLEKKVGVILGVFLAFLFCFFVSVPVHAQVTGATLSGTVTDASGAVVAGAQISVKNNATGTSRDATADSSGFYTLPNLTPGDYEVRISAKGTRRRPATTAQLLAEGRRNSDDRPSNRVCATN